jgi:RNA polymerase sigma-70 factor (ECF subfamily)
MDMADSTYGRPASTRTEQASTLADGELLQQIRARDEAALAALYDRYAGLVFTLALRVVGERELAQEVMQDTFLRCWNGAETYQATRGNVASWLLGIARNRAIDLLRSRQHQARLRESTPLPDPERTDLPGEADTSEIVATRQTVTAALNALPTTQRRVIELAYFGGLSQSEIARLLGEPLGTVKSRTRAAMDHLRALLHPAARPGGDGDR